MKIQALLLIGSMLFCNFSFAQKTNADDIIGTWVASENKAKIHIYKFNHKYYGKIIWLKEPLKEGKPKVDKHNPDPNKRHNHIVGLVVLKDFVFEDGQWVSGEIYDPSSGKEYSCKISLPNKNTMKVRGYIGISLLGRTEVWKRVNS